MGRRLGSKNKTKTKETIVNDALAPAPRPHGPGHNSQAQLRSIVERIERLEEEKGHIATVISEIYAEAKFSGYDVKALREVIRLRKVDQTKQDEHQAVVDAYMSALGMLADLPLGKAAIARDLDLDHPSPPDEGVRHT